MLVEVGALVAEQHAVLADADHVIVEYAGVDGRGILLRENGSRRIEAMPPGDRGERLVRLARRKARRRDAAAGVAK